LIDLNADERRALTKLGDKSRAFADQGLVLALGQLQGRLEDTFLAAGSDVYSQTLPVYQAAKLAGKNGALEQHLDGLSLRFVSATAAVNTPSAH